MTTQRDKEAADWAAQRPHDGTTVTAPTSTSSTRTVLLTIAATLVAAYIPLVAVYTSTINQRVAAKVALARAEVYVAAPAPATSPPASEEERQVAWFNSLSDAGKDEITAHIAAVTARIAENTEVIAGINSRVQMHDGELDMVWFGSLTLEQQAAVTTSLENAVLLWEHNVKLQADMEETITRRIAQFEAP